MGSASELLIHDVRSVFEFGRRALLEGRSFDSIESDLVFDHGVSSDVRHRAMALLVPLHNSRFLSRIGYRTWIRTLIGNLFSFGAQGAILALTLVPICLWLSFHLASWLALKYLVFEQQIGYAVAVLCLPIAWLFGWPIFWASRAYWRWRVRRIEAVENFDAMDVSSLPQTRY